MNRKGSYPALFQSRYLAIIHRATEQPGEIDRTPEKLIRFGNIILNDQVNGAILRDENKSYRTMIAPIAF